jgi:Ice-binding-like
MVPRLIARLALTVPCAAFLMAASCEHSGPTGPALGALTVLVVSPSPRALAAGGTQVFVAVGKDANGNVVTVSPAPTWSVVAGGGTINGSSGLFTAGALAGTFANTVQATSGGVSGFATVSVTPAALASITVTPNPVAVGTNASQQFTAVGHDAAGNVIPILPVPTWSVVSGYAGGTILNPSGRYTAPNAVGVGFDTVRATSGTISGSARANVSASGGLVSIAVTPNPASVIAGGTSQFTATGFDATGLVVPTPGLKWSVVPAVGGGAIDSITGLFTAGIVLGTYTNAVKATSGGISGFATVMVNATVSVGPSLGTAATYGVLAGSAFTCAGAPGTINADAGVWPGSAFTGFPPCVITGATHAADAVAQTAQGDLTTAFLALAALPCGTTITADLGGTTLAPGVYCSNSSVGVTGTVTLSGNANSLFVIRAASTLTTAGNVVLIGGAQAKNVFWWVGSSATLGTGSAWQGNILALTSITLVDNATLIGRALARNGSVNLGTSNTITLP